jgi:hypothetical protein
MNVRRAARWALRAAAIGAVGLLLFGATHLAQASEGDTAPPPPDSEVVYQNGTSWN